MIGAGVSGLGAAWLLARGGYSVVVYELKPTAGGHARTVNVTPSRHSGRAIPVDTGFIVYNTATYPDFISLLEILRVPQDNSSMSFAVSADMPDGYILEWGSDSLAALFADRSNVMRPAMYSMLWDMRRFNAAVHAFVERLETNPDAPEASITLAEFLTDGSYSMPFIQGYLIPMVSSVWSASFQSALSFPVRTLFRFFVNHGLAQTFARPQWRTILRRSRDYIEALIDDAIVHGAVICTSTRVDRVVRTSENVQVILSGNNVNEEFGDHVYDHVVFATHAPDTLKILGSGASDAERRILGAFRYSHNTSYVHTDESLMPENRGTWSAWNFLSRKHSETENDVNNNSDSVAEGQGTEFRPVCVTYWLNKLQNLNRGNDDTPDLFETLNPCIPITANKVLVKDSFSHPQFTLETVRAQEELQNTIQGENRSWFCGAYARNGFHEDGLMTGLDVAERLSGYKVLRPWRSKPCLAINNNYRRYRIPFLSPKSFGAIYFCALAVIHVVGTRIHAGLNELASRLTHADPSVVLSGGNGVLLRFGRATLATSNPGLVSVRSPRLFARVTDAIRHHRDLTPVAVAAFVAGELDCPLPSDLTKMLNALIIAQRKGPELGHGLQGQMHLAEILLHAIVGGFSKASPPMCDSRLPMVTTTIRDVVYPSWWCSVKDDTSTFTKGSSDPAPVSKDLEGYSGCWFERLVHENRVSFKRRKALEFCGELSVPLLYWMLKYDFLEATVVTTTINRSQLVQDKANGISLSNKFTVTTDDNFFGTFHAESRFQDDTNIAGLFDIIISPSLLNLCMAHFPSLTEQFKFIYGLLTPGGIAELGFSACNEARIGGIVPAKTEDEMYAGDSGFQMWSTRVVLDAAEASGLVVREVSQMNATDAAAFVRSRTSNVFSNFAAESLTAIETRTVLGQFCLWEAALLSGTVTRVALILQKPERNEV